MSTLSLSLSLCPSPHFHFSWKRGLVSEAIGVFISQLIAPLEAFFDTWHALYVTEVFLRCIAFIWIATDVEKKQR